MLSRGLHRDQSCLDSNPRRIEPATTQPVYPGAGIPEGDALWDRGYTPCGTGRMAEDSPAPESSPRERHPKTWRDRIGRILRSGDPSSRMGIRALRPPGRVACSPALLRPPTIRNERWSLPWLLPFWRWRKVTTSSPLYRGIKFFGLRWFKSGARNHLPANRSAEFRFEVRVWIRGSVTATFSPNVTAALSWAALMHRGKILAHLASSWGSRYPSFGTLCHGRGPRGGRPLLEGANVDYPRC